MPCDDCLNRREFLAKSTIAVAGAAVVASGCGDGEFGPTAVVPTAGRVTVKVSDVPALASVGQLTLVGPPTASVAVKRTGPTTFLALSTVCTHQGCETNIQSNAFVCPCHGSRFDGDGKVTRQPDSSGSATNLPTYPTSYNPATDILTIG